jgi:hypothetical protein
LLAGAAESIKPEGFDRTHRRNAAIVAPSGTVGWEPIPGQPAAANAAGNGNGHNGHHKG